MEGSECDSMFIEEAKAERIFREYRDYVYRTALLLTKSRSLADDITQETNSLKEMEKRLLRKKK
jgi:hypothetical protein